MCTAWHRVAVSGCDILHLPQLLHPAAVRAARHLHACLQVTHTTFGSRQGYSKGPIIARPCMPERIAISSWTTANMSLPIACQLAYLRLCSRGFLSGYAARCATPECGAYRDETVDDTQIYQKQMAAFGGGGQMVDVQKAFNSELAALNVVRMHANANGYRAMLLGSLYK